MDNKQLFKKYYSRLALEGLIKALVCGLIVAFSAVLITAFVTFLLDFNGLWLSIGIGFALLLASTPVFYFKIFKPTAKKVAHRLDRLGLEERLITMMWLEKDESYIAMRQREDAKEKLSKINTQQVKLRVFKIPVIAVCILAVISISMTTVSVLNSKGLLPGEQPPDPSIEEDVYVSVSYVAGEGGYILGEANQLVLYGQNTTPVAAVADEGYMFVSWSDEVGSAGRIDTSVTVEFTLTATFERVEIQTGGEPDPNSPNENPEGNEPPEESDPGDKENEDPGDSTSSGKYEDANQVIDGQTYYKDEAILNYYYEMAMEYISAGEEIPAHLKAIIEAYYATIK